jgi:hypothetical protein
MPDDPVSALGNLNARAVEEACRELARALSSEEAARQGAVEAENEIDREIETAARVTSTDAEVEALGSWLPRARHRASAARAAAELARGETARCRAVLAAARAIAKTVDSLAAQQGVETNAGAALAEGKAPDEVGRRARLP